MKWKDAEKGLKSNKTIDQMEQQIILQEIDYWRSVLERLMHIILYLAENNMAFKGSSDKLFTPHNGKYLGLIELFAKFDPIMQTHINRILRKEISDHYCGKNITNEFIALMAQEVDLQIISKIQSSKYYSIIADCTPDISHTEQLSLTLRYVDLSQEKKVEVKETFLGFIPVVDSTGKGLSTKILEELEKKKIDIQNCRGQGYDNGANMKGKDNGVQKNILNKNPLAFFLPCGCHSLNLLLCDAAKTSVKSTSLFGTLGRIYTIFSASVKRWEILKNHLKSLTVKRESGTRWEAKIESVKAVRYQISETHDALITLAEKEKINDSEIAHEAICLSEKLKDFEFLVSLVVWHDILFQINIVSKSMQNEKMDVVECTKLLKNCREFLTKYRTDGLTQAIIDAKELAIELEVEPEFKATKRIRKIKRKFDELANDEPIISPQKKFEVEFFNPALDKLIVSIDERFIQLNEHSEIWNFLYGFQNLPKKKEELLEKCMILEASLTVDETADINAKSLCEELINIQILMDQEEDTSPVNVLNYIKSRNMECLFPNVWISLRILLTFPVTVASGERSFSKLKLIKNYLRSTMCQEQLNNLAKLSIESCLAKKLKFDKLINKFASVKSRKINFFK